MQHCSLYRCDVTSVTNIFVLTISELPSGKYDGVVSSGTGERMRVSSKINLDCDTGKISLDCETGDE